MNHQLGYYQWIFNDYIEFVYLNGPIKIKDTFEQAIDDKFDGPFYGWFKYNYETNEIEGANESLQYISDYIQENGPFDGILGFSQGSTIARILMKFVNSKLFKFGIFFSPVIRMNFK